MSDADKDAIIERARSNKLRTDLVLERARSGQLFDGSQATCSEITSIIAVDKKALEQEKALLEKINKIYEMSQTESLKKAVAEEAEKVKSINAKLTNTIANLSKQGC